MAAEERSGQNLSLGETSLMTMERAMRDEIRELHERRAAAMMTEIVDLQKERDMATAKVRRLEKKVKELEEEMEKRKRRSNGEDGRVELIALLRQTLLEEQLLTSDLKRKLQSAKKENMTLIQQLKNTSLQDQSSPMARRHSDGGLLSSPHLTPAHLTPPLKPQTPSSLSPHSLNSSSPGYSPTVVPRRYKLSGVTSSDASTQTRNGTTDQSEESIADITMTEIERLIRERDEEKEKVVMERQKHEQIKKNSEILQFECGVLRESLSEFTHWVRSKLETMEENMDIVKVIYSLHSSLSQEQSVLQELQSKLRTAEQRVVQLDKENKQLTMVATEADEKQRISLLQIRKLKEKLTANHRPPLPPSSLLTPPPPSSSSRAMHTKGRKFSSPQLIHRSAS